MGKKIVVPCLKNMTNGRLTFQPVNSLVYQEHNVFLASFPSNRQFLNEIV